MPTEPIAIIINGEPKRITPNQSILTLLSELAIEPDRIAIELNKCIVRKRDWSETVVPADSQIEIVEFVGGG